jgi:DNA-binding IclR family transcriptional regulator
VVLEALKAHKLSVSLGELARELEQEALYCWKKLNLLRKRKLVKRVGHGRYIATKEVK